MGWGVRSSPRTYETGDDARRFDAAASARTGVLHVREHVPERALTVWLVCDVSASMGFGTAQRLKSDVGEGVGDVISLLAVRHAVEIGDPREDALPDAGELLVVDPETGELVEAHTSDPRSGPRSRPPSATGVTRWPPRWAPARCRYR